MDPVVFVQHRLVEGAWLVLLGLGLVMACAALKWVLAKWEHFRCYGWIYCALTAFAALNVWTFAAMHTCLFWGALYTGQATANLAQFNFKKVLLKENSAGRQLLLLGSSQTLAQLDEDRLNRRFRDQIWTTELHFPAATGFDLLMIMRRLKGFPGQDIACYVSENSFYAPFYSESAPYFFSVADLPLLSSLGCLPQLIHRHFGYGIAGEVVPLFRCRGPLTDRVLGRTLGSLAQSEYDATLDTNLVKRAQELAPKFRLGHEQDLQKEAFELFIVEAAKQGRRVTILEGQFNPVLGSMIDPAVRPDMRKFLSRLAKDHPNVVLLREEVLPRQSAEDYGNDLTHVNHEGEARFTDWFGDYLARNMLGH